MLFSTSTQWIVLALALVAGWLLGLASHPGGRRWRDRYAAERDAHAATRAQAETRVADTRRSTDDRLAQADARIAELERDNARLSSAAPVPSATRIEREVPGDTPVYAPDPVRPAATARPAFTASPAGMRRGWFEWR